MYPFVGPQLPSGDSVRLVKASAWRPDLGDETRGVVRVTPMRTNVRRNWESILGCRGTGAVFLGRRFVVGKVRDVYLRGRLEWSIQ